jgi:hypothetical protein
MPWGIFWKCMCPLPPSRVSNEARGSTVFLKTRHPHRGGGGLLSTNRILGGKYDKGNVTKDETLKEKEVKRTEKGKTLGIR